MKNFFFFITSIKFKIDVILTTYNMICSRPEDRKFFKKFSLNYVIYDEGHMLRSCNTQRYQNLMKVRGARKLLLTGTPLQNNLVELISLMFFTMTKMFTEYFSLSTIDFIIGFLGTWTTSRLFYNCLRQKVLIRLQININRTGSRK